MEFVRIVHKPHPFLASAEPGVAGQRNQTRIAVVSAIVAAAIVYLLVILSHKRAGCGPFVIRV
jgi:hypothetical protein